MKDKSGTTITYTTEEDIQVLPAIIVDSTVNEATATNIQFEIGSVKTEYMPYVENIEAVTVTRCGKNLLNVPYDYSFAKRVTITLDVTLRAGVQYMLYVDDVSYSIDNSNGLVVCLVDGTNTRAYIRKNKTRYAITPVADTTVLQMYSNGYSVNDSDGVTAYIKGLRLYVDTNENMDYEAYKESTSYQPGADGSVDGVASISPTMTLATDKEGVVIDLEYNKDMNKVIEKLTNTIISLGGNI